MNQSSTSDESKKEKEPVPPIPLQEVKANVTLIDRTAANLEPRFMHRVRRSLTSWKEPTMDVDAVSSKAAFTNSVQGSPPESETYLRLLIIYRLLSSRTSYGKALELAYMNGENPGAESSDNGPDRDESVRTAALRHDDETQASLLNYLLRKRIKAVQLNYSDAHSNLQQAIRRAPSPKAAPGFYQAVHKFFVVVELPMGDIRERNLFSILCSRKLSAHTFEIPFEVVRYRKHAAQFEADRTYTLIVRLRQNVIKTGIRCLSLSYLLGIFASSSTFDSEEYIVGKAIRDGVIESRIVHEKGWMEYPQEKSLLQPRERNVPPSQSRRHVQELPAYGISLLTSVEQQPNLIEADFDVVVQDVGRRDLKEPLSTLCRGKRKAQDRLNPFTQINDDIVLMAQSTDVGSAVFFNAYPTGIKNQSLRPELIVIHIIMKFTLIKLLKNALGTRVIQGGLSGCEMNMQSKNIRLELRKSSFVRDFRKSKLLHRTATPVEEYWGMNTIFTAIPDVTSASFATSIESSASHPYSVAPSALQTSPYGISTSELPLRIGRSTGDTGEYEDYALHKYGQSSSYRNT
ncbi:hypothetical protein F5887DRAFT_1206052 [Amanita rubescens]|nr:hypothetical protein F5887DRAFT_1206052 [Amanita rubescens]